MNLNAEADYGRTCVWQIQKQIPDLIEFYFFMENHANRNQPQCMIQKGAADRIIVLTSALLC